MLPKIFDMFTLGDRSLERSRGGLGVGLTLVRNLVGLHGGTVDVRSDGPGSGSEFTVRLPIDPRAQPISEPRAVPSKRSAVKALRIRPGSIVISPSRSMSMR
jgi:two-component system, sensor histidine kinase